MTLPASGPISLNNVNVELGLSGTTSINMNQASVRTLFGKASGAISMSDGYGKSNRAAVSYTFTSSTANAALNVSSIGGYVSGATDITVTVNSGVYLYATSTGNYGLNLTGATTGDTVTLVNNGFILGQGGVGRGGTAGQSGLAGGPALNIGIGTNITVNNTNGSAYIAGGGGSGGAGIYGRPSGGGAGGGAGGSYVTAAGGAGGSIGASGGNGAYTTSPCPCGGTNRYYGAGGGGRILPGVGGAGGTGTIGDGYGRGGGAGGGSAVSNGASAAGGSANAAGTDGPFASGLGPGGGGGGWGASGGTGRSTSGGAGGKAVNLNGKSVTWVSGNTTRVYGAVS